MKLASQFNRIRLNLARSKTFPAGSDVHGYEIVAPLDAHGHIDPRLWKEQREICSVRRFWNGDDEQIGLLVHKPGGPEHARWVFDYDASRSDRQRRARMKTTGLASKTAPIPFPACGVNTRSARCAIICRPRPRRELRADRTTSSRSGSATPRRAGPCARPPGCRPAPGRWP